MTTERIVKCSPGELHMIDRVLGQLSDGIWENSSRMNPYWKCNTVVAGGVKMIHGCQEYTGYCQNPLYYKTDEEVRSWFADKLKQVVKEFINDGWNPKTEWSRVCNEECGYLGFGDTIAMAYKAYDSLKGRADKTGSTVKQKLSIRAGELREGDKIGNLEVKDVFPPFTDRDIYYTVVFTDDSVERYAKQDMHDVVRKTIVE